METIEAQRATSWAALPEWLDTETEIDYRAKHNLPVVFEPFYPYGRDMVEWQQNILKENMGAFSISPFPSNVGRSLSVVYIVFNNEEQITSLAREWIKRFGGGYGAAIAERHTPSIEGLREMYRRSVERRSK